MMLAGVEMAVDVLPVHVLANRPHCEGMLRLPISETSLANEVCREFVHTVNMGSKDGFLVLTR